MLGWRLITHSLQKDREDMQKTTLLSLTLIVLLGACTPTVQVAAPDKPIEINMNIKIEHEIRVKVDKDLDLIFDDDSDLF